MNKLITIIVPVYKVEEYLDRCVTSIVNQTYENIEIILIDDGSPDNCPQMCDEWAKKDKRVKVYHKKNGGLSSARNLGIRESNGEYILFVDSDDMIDSETCRVLMNYADDVDLIVGEATIIEENKTWHRTHKTLKENVVYSGEECAVREIKGNEWFAAACYNMYKRTFLLDNGLFFVEGILHEDIDYLPRLFLAAKTVKYIHFEFYKYIIRESSICGTKSKKHYDDLMETYSRWAVLNEEIENNSVKKVFNGALSKFFISTCREYKNYNSKYPIGITNSLLLRNSLNLKELLKTLLFVFARRFYVNL